MKAASTSEIQDPGLRALYENAERARVLKDWRRSADLFRAFAERAPQSKWRSRAITRRLICLSSERRWEEQEAVAMQDVDCSPDANGWIHHFLGEALYHLGRRDEALAALEQALAINPLLTETRNLVAVVTGGEATEAGPGVVPAARWPARRGEFEDLRAVIRERLLTGVARERFIRPDSAFTTLGSCFAHNLALALAAAGRTAHCEMIGEEVNSPLANRHLVDWLERGAHSRETEVMAAAFGEAMRERMRAGLAAADVVVLTIGVAPSFFSLESGEFVFMHARGADSVRRLLATARMRTPTVAEAADDILHVCGALRRLAAPGARVVITQSPAPLAFTNEFGSAILADCLSKSTLRLACHQAAEDPAGGLLYWPSFEIVRWLGAHLGPGQPPAYGEDDENSRHVSRWLVALIVEEFLEFYGADAGA